jgi:hypothetical protein
LFHLTVSNQLLDGAWSLSQIALTVLEFFPKMYIIRNVFLVSPGTQSLTIRH